MIDFLKIVAGGLLGGLLVLGLSLNSVPAAVGGTTNFDDLSVTSITNSGTFTQTGAVTFSSTIGVTGAADFDSTANVDGLFTSGGSVLSTSTASTAMVPTAATFNYGLIEITPNTADLTYTFPASSTLSAMIPDAGDSRIVYVYNATTTAGIDVIFAAGAGMEIKAVGTATSLSLDEASIASLTFIRKANSDILVLMATPLHD